MKESDWWEMLNKEDPYTQDLLLLQAAADWFLDNQQEDISNAIRFMAESNRCPFESTVGKRYRRWYNDLGQNVSKYPDTLIDELYNFLPITLADDTTNSHLYSSYKDAVLALSIALVKLKESKCQKVN